MFENMKKQVGFIDRTYHVNENLKIASFSNNTDDMINYFLNSRDSNTFYLGVFLNCLVRHFRLNLTDEMKKIIINSLDKDMFNNFVYNKGHLDYFKALSNSCVIYGLIRTNQNAKMMKVFQMMLHNTFQVENEFSTIIELLNSHVANYSLSMLNEVIDAYVWAYQNFQKEDALNNVRKLIALIDVYNANFYETIGISFCDLKRNIIYLNKDLDDKLVIFHEVGHMIDNYIRIRKNDYHQNMAHFKRHALKYPFFEKEICELKKVLLTVERDATIEYTNSVIRKYGSVENLLMLYKNYIIEMIQNKNLHDIFLTYMMNKKQTDAILKNYYAGRLNYDGFAKLLYRIDLDCYTTKCMLKYPEALVTDIISSVFKNRNIKIKGHNYELPIAHDRDYYQKNDDYVIAEIMANYNALVITNQKELIQRLRNIFGNDFVDYLNLLYKKNPDNIERDRLSKR